MVLFGYNSLWTIGQVLLLECARMIVVYSNACIMVILIRRCYGKYEKID